MVICKMFLHLVPAEQLNWSQLSISWSVGATMWHYNHFMSDHPFSPPYETFNLTIYSYSDCYTRACQILMKNEKWIVFISTAQESIRFCSQISELSLFFWFDNSKLPKFAFEIYKGIHLKYKGKYFYFSFLHFSSNFVPVK